MLRLRVTEDGLSYHEIEVLEDWVVVTKNKEFIKVLSPSRTFITYATNEGVLEAFTKAAEQLGIDNEFLESE